MLDFKKARDWATTSSPQTIFQRHAIYAVYFQAFEKKSFGHDLLLNIVISFTGRFEALMMVAL